MNELLEILNELRPDIIALTEEISDTFGVIIKPKQLTAENFDSVDAMMKLIESLK